MMQSVYIQRIMKKNADMGYEKTKSNKPNSNPIKLVLECRSRMPGLIADKLMRKPLRLRII